MEQPGYLKDAYRSLRDGALALAREAGAGKLAELAVSAPDIIYTLLMLLRDRRVPRRAKLRLAIAAAYFAMPLDALPFGVLDDVYVALIALAGVMDDIGESLLCAYWPGDPGDLVRFKAVLDSLNERFGAGAVRRLGKRLGIGVEISVDE